MAAAGTTTFTVINDAPSSANVSVSGRVFTPDARGLLNAKVSITDLQTNITRTVLTSSFGFYSFDNISLGGNYLIRVKSKQYLFSSRQMSINGTLMDVDFTGTQ